MEENNSIYAEEAARIEDYVYNVYAEKNPEISELDETELSFWNIVGIEAVMFGASGVSAFLFSGFRTGIMFYVIEELMASKFEFISDKASGIIGFIMAVLAVMTFELFLAGKGFKDGKEKGEVSANKTAVILAGVVILAGGMFTSMFLVESLISSIQIWIYLIIALITAFAGAIIVFYSTENLGFVFHTYLTNKKAMIDENRNERDTWKSKAIKSFWTSRQGREYAKEKEGAQSEQSPTSSEKQSSLTRREKIGQKYTWAIAKKKLNPEDIHYLRNHSPKDISSEFSLSEKTASNWRKFAREQFTRAEE